MKTNKKELTVFALCAYAIPFLMMPLLYICLQNGQDTSIFANAQMFYPAAGVMLAFLLARRPDTPKRFYSLHIVSAVLMLVMSVLSVAMPQTGVADHCQRCHYYCLGAGLDTAADREKGAP